MNFEAGFFESEAGFWIALGGMALAGAAVMLVARWRRWM
jgi:Mg2+ and Co2+ transporter CorA